MHFGRMPSMNPMNGNLLLSLVIELLKIMIKKPKSKDFITVNQQEAYCVGSCYYGVKQNIKLGII